MQGYKMLKEFTRRRCKNPRPHPFWIIVCVFPGLVFSCIGRIDKVT